MSGICPPSKTCDFEVDFCDFTNFDNINLKWERSESGSIAGVMYPDHTSQVGSFAYLDLAVGSINEKGRLISQSYRPIGPECLQFWYYSSLKDLATLNVLKFGKGNYTDQLWSKKEFNVGEWQFGQVQIGDNINEFSIIFEGVKNIMNKGILGIDDVLLRVGTCPPPTNCNFEDGTICSWSQYYNDELDWLLIQGQKGLSKIFLFFFKIDLPISTVYRYRHN